MRRYLPLMLVLLAAWGCGTVQRTLGMAPGRPASLSVLPADETEGWEQDIPDNPVRYYGRENLYLYLRQKTDLYNDYGFLKLSHATYRPNLLGKPTVTIDAYKMDLPLHAYGIFSVERNRSDKMIDVGGGGHVGATECVFWKGSHFVRIRLIDKVEDPEQVLTGLAMRTANNIRGTTDVPELRLFPAENRTPGGDSYYVKDLLGYDFLARGFTVEYDLGGRKATMFLAIFPPEMETRRQETTPAPVLTVTTAAYVELRRALLKAGEAPQVLPGPWEHGYRATEPQLGNGPVVRSGRYIAGTFGAPSEDVALKMTASLVQRLP